MYFPHWPKFIAKNTNKDRLEPLSNHLELLANPQNDIQNVIHISGTNGKGSTANFIANILRSSKHSVNLFTAPHLIHYNECFNLNGNKISNDNLNKIISTVINTLGYDTDLSLFEASFLYALIAFKQSPAEYNIFETGLGGRIDPTILLKNKIFNIFTPISLDHQEFLGPNIESITCEKAYTISSNAKTIIAPQPTIALGILKEFSTANKTEYLCYEEDYDFFTEDNLFSFVDIKAQKIYEFSPPNLIGNHQLINLATSLCCIKEIISLDNNQEAIDHAIRNIDFANRLQKMPHHLLKQKQYENCEIWCDGAHNISGAKAIAKWLTEQESKYTFLLYGRTAKKDHLTFIKEFENAVDEIVFFEISEEALPCRKNELLESIKNSDIINLVKTEDDLPSAISYCFNTKKTPFRIIMCGSLYIFRDYKKI